ncbi:MAG: DNA replication complex GINS family protein [Hadesarchaea archaeon]|nr:DNA replication complex GINS family protein [Hadesarchaea archaeon]
MRQRVRAVKDFPEVELVGRKIGPLAVGDEVELWFWDANALRNSGFVEFLQPISPTELRKLVFAEERDLEPIMLPDNFYISIARNAALMSQGGKKMESDEIFSQVSLLLDARLPKLIRLALSPEVPLGLTPEERLLVNEVSKFIDDWSRRLRRLFEFREEVGKNGEGRPVQYVVGDKADIQKQGVSEADLHPGGAAT